MSACEQCWSKAYVLHRMNPTKSQVEHYRDLIKTPDHAIVEGLAATPQEDQ